MSMNMKEELPPGGPPPHIGDMSNDLKDEHNPVYYACVQTTRMPMVVTDPNLPDNPIVFANPAFIHMTGYEEHEIIGQNCRFLQGPETDRETVAEIRAAIESGDYVSVEILNYRKNGSSFWNALFLSPVYDLKGNILFFFASQLDVTRRREIEEAYRQSQKMEAVGLLTGGVAHDFNNLLAVVLGFTELLQVQLSRDVINLSKTDRAIQAILQATEKGQKLTSQLLAFARKQKLQGRIVNIKDFVDQLLPFIEKSVGDGVEVVTYHDEKACNIRIDPVQAELAILNISANARDAMNRAGTLTVSTQCVIVEASDTKYGKVSPGNYTALSFTDTGSGMDPDILAKITEPFFTTKGEGKGTGLGMSMVDGFIKQSGGSLIITSETGKGTTVQLLFRCEDAEVEPVYIKAQRPPALRKGEKETILVVEDRADVSEYVQEVLSDFGYSILSASNAEEALDVLKANPQIDLLFSDIIMPGLLNGVQLAREVRSLYPKIKILLTTGYTDSSIEITDTHGVPFNVINKPCNRVDLTNRIRDVIDGPNGIS